jgi:hypothetical protein
LAHNCDQNLNHSQKTTKFFNKQALGRGHFNQKRACEGVELSGNPILVKHTAEGFTELKDHIWILVFWIIFSYDTRGGHPVSAFWISKEK